MDPDPRPRPDPPSEPPEPPWPGPDLPPPPDAPDGPAARLAALRARFGLDGRAAAWVATAAVAVVLGAWFLRPAGAAVEETLPMATTAPAVAGGSAGPGAAGDVDGGAAGDGASTSTVTTPSEVVAHAAGAVAHPGVYTLPATARVDDLVRAAGGLTPDADAARLNLAAPLADGARVYVPRIGEGAPPEVVGPEGSPGAPPAGPVGDDDDSPPALVDLNTATEDELDELPGVGPAIAAAIVAFREENGGFASVDDLLDVRGIGEAKLDDLRPLVTVG